jgi:hypothetical protein
VSTNRYPNDLPFDYHFSIQFKTYSRPNPFTGKINLNDPAHAQFGLEKTGIAAAPAFGDPIFLPIPSNIINALSLKWDQESALLGQSMVQTFSDAQNGTKDALGRDIAGLGIGASQIIGNVIGSFFPATTQTGAAAGGAVGGAISAAGKSVLQASGVALNPVLTQFFSNPDFKRHEFAWKFAPENQDESYALKNIIDRISYNALPGTAAGGLFFTYPSIALLNIHTGDTTPYKFQPCVVENVTVNYAGAGAPSWFARTSHPTVVEVHIRFLEIILNTRDNWSGYDTPLDFSSGLSSWVTGGTTNPSDKLSTFFNQN